ncbi:MAG: sigma-70 family RNA polymerase sigma factor [Actinomycetota bacterium]|nr:sigma-70 family RNA polymerase sigma factor [Actinomycetota bacterium]
MPRTKEQLERAAADAERWLDELDPAELDNPEADATDLRRIGLALRAVASAETELAEAVRAARGTGRSWGLISTVLGVSRQAARVRFGEPAVPTGVQAGVIA